MHNAYDVSLLSTLALARALRCCFKMHAAKRQAPDSAMPQMWRVGQNRIYTYIYTVYLVISKQKLPYVHRIYMVLANPTDVPFVIAAHFFRMGKQMMNNQTVCTFLQDVYKTSEQIKAAGGTITREAGPVPGIGERRVQKSSWTLRWNKRAELAKSLIN